MKPKHTIIAAIILLSQNAFGQYFNHEIPNFYYNGWDRQTICKNSLNEIVFLTVNDLSPTYPHDIELSKVDQAGNFLLSKRVLDTFGNLTPGSILTTSDDHYIVAGTYNGYAPLGYPPVPGGMIHTTFYAKFDNSFNLLWFKLQYSYPLGLPNVIMPEIDPYGIIAVPAGVSENYIIVNLTYGYDTLTNSIKQRILIDKIDPLGNLIKEVHTNLPTTLDLGVPTISYLPTSGVCVIACAGLDNTIASLPSVPFVITFDPGLGLAYHFTKYTSLFNHYCPSNVVEDQTNTANMLFCMQSGNATSFSNSCAPMPKLTSLELMKVKIANPTSLLFSRDYTSSCMQDAFPPLYIKNVPSEPGNIMLGLTQVMHYATPSYVNNIPALLALNSTFDVLKYHLYNDAFQRLRLQSFDNYVADSFMIHVNQRLNDTTFATRIIKTDKLGQTFCASTINVDTTSYDFTPVDTSMLLMLDTAYLYTDHPVLDNDEFYPQACDSVFHKSPVTHVNNAIIPTLMLYPNPVSDELKIVTDENEGVIKKITLANASGQAIDCKENLSAAGNSTVINISRLKPGLYFVELEDSNGTKTRRSFVKR